MKQRQTNNGSIRKREVTQPQQHTEYYLFNSQGNLKAYSDDIMSFAYYGYNASNTRTYKISLNNTNVWINGQPQALHMQLQQAMFYPNTYLNFDAFGNYTKHYYNGMERIASRLGDNTTTIALNNNILEARKLQLEEQFREDIHKLIEETVPIDLPPFIDVNALQPTGTPNDIYYYHPNHLGNTAFITDDNATITQGFLYAPFGEITTEYNINFGNNVIPKYSFNAKELDEETGMYYYEARYYAPPTFTSRDPLFEKYFWISPYAYCVNNPVNVIDPTGKDTLNVTYNNETNKWDISTPIVAAGNDVINVTLSDGVNCSVLFSEGEYGKRICNVTLEDNGEQTLNVFMLSGAGFAGFAVEPSGVADNSKRADKGEIAPIECGIYNIGSVGGDKWKGWPEQYNKSSGSNLLSKGRGVAIHYAWSNIKLSQNNLKARNWTTKCAIVSSSYSKDANGVVLFNGNESKAMAQKVAIYCGATGFKKRKDKYDQCIGIPSNCSVIRIVK